MDNKAIKSYFESEPIVEHYAQASTRLGLWQSEEKIFTRVFKPSASLLELGCGTGRIAFGLHELGFENVLATDYSKAMITRARHLAKLLEYSVPFRVEDATNLEFEDNIFDGAFFGFNGLMQIPGAALREQALSEILRVIRQGSWFVFTTHDRDHSKHPDFWIEEVRRWETHQQSEELECLGDRFEIMDDGVHFMHVPTFEEMKVVLERVGFRIEATALRSEVAAESPEVIEFSDECRFWVVQKPDV